MVIRMLKKFRGGINKLSKNLKSLSKHEKWERSHKKGLLKNEKSAISEMNKLEGINSKLDESEDQISYLKDRVAENTQSVWQKRKREKEDSWRDLWGNIKQ